MQFFLLPWIYSLFHTYLLLTILSFYLLCFTFSDLPSLWNWIRRCDYSTIHWAIREGSIKDWKTFTWSTCSSCKLAYSCLNINFIAKIAVVLISWIIIISGGGCIETFKDGGVHRSICPHSHHINAYTRGTKSFLIVCQNSNPMLILSSQPILLVVFSPYYGQLSGICITLTKFWCAK